MSNKQSKTKKVDQTPGQPLTTRTRELEVWQGKACLTYRITEDFVTPPEAYNAAVDSHDTAADATWSSQIVGPATLHVFEEKPTQANDRDELIADVIRLEQERDDLKDRLRRMTADHLNADAQARQLRAAYEASEKHAGELRRRLDAMETGAGTPFMEANAQLRQENEELAADRDRWRYRAQSIDAELVKLRTEAYNAAVDSHDALDDLNEARAQIDRLQAEKVELERIVKAPAEEVPF